MFHPPSSDPELSIPTPQAIDPLLFKAPAICTLANKATTKLLNEKLADSQLPLASLRKQIERIYNIKKRRLVATSMLQLDDESYEVANTRLSKFERDLFRCLGLNLHSIFQSAGPDIKRYIDIDVVVDMLLAITKAGLQVITAPQQGNVDFEIIFPVDYMCEEIYKLGGTDTLGPSSVCGAALLHFKTYRKDTARNALIAEFDAQHNSQIQNLIDSVLSIYETTSKAHGTHIIAANDHFNVIVYSPTSECLHFIPGELRYIKLEVQSKLDELTSKETTPNQ